MSVFSNPSRSLYTVALSAGVSGGIIIAGLITITHTWRYIYYVATALIGALTLLVFFTLPETSFIRTINRNGSVDKIGNSSNKFESNLKTDVTTVDKVDPTIEGPGNRTGARPTRNGKLSSFALFNGTFTSESLWRMAYRPVILLVLPPVLWATLVMSVTIGFLVAISSNFSSAFQTAYGFKSWQSGLCFVSGLIGTLLGILGGGWFSDWVADYLTRRNGGIREPEMRLPAITVALIASPVALVLYGCGIEQGWHWIVPTIGLGLRELQIPHRKNALLTCLSSKLRHRARN